MLKDHFNTVCDDVWGRLECSLKFSISQGEETITDNLLLYLASQNLPSITIVKTPKNQESITGADWEWWIGNPHRGYLRYAVQAKKLNLKKKTYGSLKHRVVGGTTTKYQHEILREYARANHAIPIYAFYNYLKISDRPRTWNCSQPMDHSKLGCTVTPLSNVELAISKRGWRTFKKIHSFPETIPLRCLVGCPSVISSALKARELAEDQYDRKPVRYENPRNLLSNIESLTSFKQFPRELYDHDIGYYPKKILIIETEIAKGQKEEISII